MSEFGDTVCHEKPLTLTLERESGLNTLNSDDNAARWRRWHALVTCNIGVCLEGFDFIAYTAFAPILARQFFPVSDPLSSTLLVFLGFGAAYIARPLGGLFWGLYADRAGRRRALASIAVMMGLGTAVIAIAPPYAVIGLAAPVLVMLGRLIQGFAASGEFASATAMLVELAPVGRKTLYASTQMASQVLTIALAMGAVLLLSALLQPAVLENWGWRIAFAVGALVAPLGVYMRMRMIESPEFLALRARSQPATPAAGAMLKSLGVHWRALTAIGGIVVISAAALYLILVFMPVHAINTLGLPAADVRRATILCALFEVPVIIIAAVLADRIGGVRVMLPAALLWALAAWPLYAWMVEVPAISRFLAAQLIAVTLLGALSGPMPAVMSGLLPTALRSSGIGFVFNAVGAVFGGLGPFLITVLIAATGDPAAPAWWAALTGAVGAVTLIWLARGGARQAAHLPMEQTDEKQSSAGRQGRD